MSPGHFGYGSKPNAQPPFENAATKIPSESCCLDGSARRSALLTSWLVLITFSRRKARAAQSRCYLERERVARWNLSMAFDCQFGRHLEGAVKYLAGGSPGPNGRVGRRGSHAMALKKCHVNALPGLESGGVKAQGAPFHTPSSSVRRRSSDHRRRSATAQPGIAPKALDLYTAVAVHA